MANEWQNLLAAHIAWLVSNAYTAGLVVPLHILMVPHQPSATFLLPASHDQCGDQADMFCSLLDAMHVVTRTSAVAARAGER